MLSSCSRYWACYASRYDRCCCGCIASWVVLSEIKFLFVSRICPSCDCIGQLNYVVFLTCVLLLRDCCRKNFLIQPTGSDVKHSSRFSTAINSQCASLNTVQKFNDSSSTHNFTKQEPVYKLHDSALGYEMCECWRREPAPGRHISKNDVQRRRKC
jgi:hypothetical protein